MILRCPEYNKSSLYSIRLHDRQDLRARLSHPVSAAIITNWIMETKRLEEYSLAKILDDDGRGSGRPLPDRTNPDNAQGTKKKKMPRRQLGF